MSAPKDPKDPNADKQSPPGFDLKRSAREHVQRLKTNLAGEMEKALRKPSSKYGGPIRISSGVPMKFPYTFTAKIVQFPWKFYVNNNWIYKYYLIAVVVSIPFFKKISNVVNSPENKAKWAAIRKKEALEHAHH